MSKRILIIEDEPQMRLVLRDNLELEGYEVETAGDGEQGLASATTTPPDLILLDLTLPGIDGFEVCRQLRAIASPTPVVMVTARSNDQEKMIGFDIGADDYVTKPFRITELVARIRAILRRAKSDSVIEKCDIGELHVDFASHVAERNGERVDFTAREFAFLRYLMFHVGEVVPRERILSAVWGYKTGVTTRTIDAFVVKLRGKIEIDPHHPVHILTVHGQGYKFVA
jgi:DNA-binding response OmpR family regulator